MIDRRLLLALGGVATVAPSAARAASLEIVDLWPGPAPGGQGVTVTERSILRTPGGDPNDTAFLNITRPVLMLRRPAKPNGAALLMIPGGGFARVAVSKAGGAIDAWLAEQGFTVFVMTYRLPADGWAAGPDVALQDAQRAMRLIRGRAAELGFDPAKVGVLGFSAGGHVAARLATQFARDTYAPVDRRDALPTRPIAAGLFYPVVTLRAPHAHGGSLRALLGETPTEAARAAISVEDHLPAETPPTFIAAAADDRVVPVENSLLLHAALRARKIPTELHVFEVGGHGIGLREADGALHPWTGLLTAFLRRHGVTA